MNCREAAKFLDNLVCRDCPAATMRICDSLVIKRGPDKKNFHPICILARDLFVRLAEEAGNE